MKKRNQIITRLFALLLVLLFVVSTGCGKEKESDTPTETSSTETDASSASEESSSAASEADPSVIEPSDSSSSEPASSSASSEESSTDTVSRETMYVSASNVNVRSMPNTDSEILGTVNYRDEITCTGMSGDWYQVEFEGKTGYILSDYITKEFATGFESSVDKDEDGIDDQTDILINTKNYLATRPQYESKWYNEGYPDDGYGVCTDVIAFALRDAGYDLRQLIYDDIPLARDEYGIEDRDINIDFRRVPNQMVYAKRHFVAKTTDLSLTEEWQPGDIVFWEHHVGIISDRRRDDGVPYILHHRDPGQEEYEEDFFARGREILGHYRVSE